MRLLVTGKDGQVVRALLERGPLCGAEIVGVGRPELDLTEPSSIARTLDPLAADLIVNAAAYTAVDRAESEEDLAYRVNGVGAGLVAEAAARKQIPIIHLSTDYVFPGDLDRPYREEDVVSPVSAYGRTKLAGEEAVRSANPSHVVLRTAWVYSHFGSNFVKTMLRLASNRDEISVVSDQLGNPTSALDIADCVIQVARSILGADRPADLFGTYHMVAAEEATWAEFARQIFEEAHLLRKPQVIEISTAEYPTAAKRPANSRLATAKLRERFGIVLPSWRCSLPVCVRRLQAAANGENSR